MNNSTISTWINGSSNVNYYDNVMAFYTLYYRSGIDDYLNYARNLADIWYTMPWFDQGRAALSGSSTLFPRLQSITGLVLRALDGQPSYWSGIEQYVNYDYGFANVPPAAGMALNDIREQGYATAFLALAALYDPTPANQATYVSELETVISNVWAPAAQPGGNWMNITDGNATWNGAAGTAIVQNGSNIVNGTNTAWEQDWFNQNSFWTADPNGVTNGDSIAYTATVLSPTQLSLNIPYQGANNSGRGWQANNLVGTGTQPFMLGVVGNSFYYAYLATGDARLPGYLTNIQNWLSTQGYRPDARGLWYGRVFPNCEPIAITNSNCSGGNVEQSRFLSGEVVGTLSAAYLISGNGAVATFGDNLYGAMFGGPTGGPDSDSTYVTDVAPGGWAMQNNLAKDFGFFFGFGGGSTWPAARLGTSALPPPMGCSYSLAANGAALPSGGGTGTVSITASAPGCPWTATSASPGVSITAGAAGSGTGSAAYMALPNQGVNPLTETLQVANQTFTITQAGVGCTYSFTPQTVSVPSGAGTGTINLIANGNSCGWTAAASASWITITGSLSGNGTAAIGYALAANTGGVRSGTITVAGQVLSITQAGVACLFTLAPATAFSGGQGGPGVITLTASPSSCTWTAVSNAPFATVTGGASGTGNGSVNYSVSANTTPTSRTGTLTVAGITFTLTQSPQGGTLTNVGNAVIPGTASLNNGVYTVSGAGGGIYGISDQFSFNRWAISGNATLTARLTSLTNTSTWTKAGVMMRSALAGNAPNAFALATTTMAEEQYRLTPGAVTVSAGSTPMVFPIWLRVTMANGVLTSYSSPDGKTWKAMGAPQTIPMATAYLGLAVGSQLATAAATATFDNLTITQP
jgi:hypothetical protein